MTDVDLGEKIERLNRLLEEADANDRIRITYLPVAWWRQPVKVPAWVAGLLILNWIALTVVKRWVVLRD